MINELVNFVNDLPSEVFSYQLKLEEGLYFELDISEDGEPVLVNSETHKVSKEPKELSPFLEKCLQLQTVTKHEFQVNKCFN